MFFFAILLIMLKISTISVTRNNIARTIGKEDVKQMLVVKIMSNVDL